jgi:hypothetical protein
MTIRHNSSSWENKWITKRSRSYAQSTVMVSPHCCLVSYYPCLSLLATCLFFHLIYRTFISLSICRKRQGLQSIFNQGNLLNSLFTLNLAATRRKRYLTLVSFLRICYFVFALVKMEPIALTRTAAQSQVSRAWIRRPSFKRFAIWCLTFLSYHFNLDSSVNCHLKKKK